MNDTKSSGRKTIAVNKRARFEYQIEDRLEALSQCFAVSVCGFAVMDNHLHVLVRLDDSNFDLDDAVEGEVRFSKSDGTTPLYYEIEGWRTADKAAEVWVLVDTVYADNNTQYFNMYWGKSGETSRSR